MADAAAAAAAAAAADKTSKRTPSDFLKNVLGRPVVVKLNSGVDYRGVPRHRLALRHQKLVLAADSGGAAGHTARALSFDKPACAQASLHTWTAS